MKKTFTVPIALVIALFFMTAGSLRAQADIVFISDDTNDDYNIEFLEDQGFNVTKFWTGSINTWTPADSLMVDGADLVIIGRSIGSGEHQDSIERVYWHAITAPVIYVSPYHVRNSRSHLFNSGTATTITSMTADINIPGDAIFTGVTLDANTLGWFDVNSNCLLDVSGSSNGEMVASIGDTIPLVVRFEADKAFYVGGPDSAAGPRTYFGFGIEGYGDVSAQKAHFPLSKAAKQVYLNEITRILGIAQQTAVYAATDYSVIFLSDDTNDDYNIAFLKRQGLNVTQFWDPNGNVSTWGADTIAMLDAAELIIAGRSIGSANWQQPADRDVWNALTTPLVQISPYAVRNSRNHWFNSGSATTITGMTADINIPGDGVFDDVMLDANTLEWFSGNSNCLLDVSGESNGEMVASIGDTIPLLVRFGADKAFYPGGPDSAVAERIYFGFGIEPYDNVSAEAAHFPLTKDAKQVYFAEISRILGFPSTDIVLGAPEFTITFMTDDSNDSIQMAFLMANGFTVNQFWPGADITTWSQDTLDMLDEAELIIVGRSIGSGESQQVEKRTVWNAIEAPLIHNSPYPLRSSRANWFNTTTILETTETLVAEAVLADDPVFMYAPSISGGEMDWVLSNSNYLVDVSGANNGTVVVGIGDTIPLLVRFEADKAFYPGGPDSAVAPRIHMAMGAEPGANHFPLTANAQAVYYAEILSVLGGEIAAPIFFGTDKELKSLSVDKGTLDPAFDSETTAYTLDLGADDDMLHVQAAGGSTSTVVADTGMIAIAGDTTIYVTSTSEVGQFVSYSIVITKEVVEPPDAINDLSVNSENVSVYPNPFNDMLSISSTNGINSIEIIDMQGKVVYQVRVNSNETELNLSELDAGIYLIRTQTAENSYINRVIKK